MAELLFLAHRIPYPPDRGDKIRSWHVLKHLAGLAKVHLACFADDEADAAHLPGLREALGGRLGEAQVELRPKLRPLIGARALLTGTPLSLPLFGSATMTRFVDSILARPEVEAVYAYSGQMAQYVPAGVRQRFVMDFVDVDSAKFADYARDGSGPMRWVHAREGKRLAAFERETAARADLSLLVSGAEAALMRERTGIGHIAALSNGINLAHFDAAASFPALPPQELGDAPLLLFTGQMDYRPNVEAVSWFAREVLPRLPGARFVIAGRAPVRQVLALAGERIKVTGAVDDMRSWLAAADVVVAPLHIARGIQNKVLEAMAMARPVVASPAAFEGIEAQPSRDLIVADGAEAMTRAVADLLDDHVRAAQIGHSARNLVEHSYGWDARLAPLAGMVFPDAQAKAAA